MGVARLETVQAFDAQLARGTNRDCRITDTTITVLPSIHSPDAVWRISFRVLGAGNHILRFGNFPDSVSEIRPALARPIQEAVVAEHVSGYVITQRRQPLLDPKTIRTVMF